MTVTVHAGDRRRRAMLSHICRAPGPVTLSELRKRFGGQNAIVTLWQLVEAGLVDVLNHDLFRARRQTPCPRDRSTTPA